MFAFWLESRLILALLIGVLFTKALFYSLHSSYLMNKSNIVDPKSQRIGRGPNEAQKKCSPSAKKTPSPYFPHASHPLPHSKPTKVMQPRCAINNELPGRLIIAIASPHVSMGALGSLLPVEGW